MARVGEIPVGGERVLRKPNGRGVMGRIKRVGPDGYQAIGPGGTPLRTGVGRKAGTVFDDYDTAFNALRYYHG